MTARNHFMKQSDYQHTYSNSKAGVLSYVSMFESLWKQTELYEKLKSNEKMQKEFINVATHK